MVQSRAGGGERMQRGRGGLEKGEGGWRRRLEQGGVGRDRAAVLRPDLRNSSRSDTGYN